MEAITIGGLAVLAMGGYFSAVDFMHDLGLCGKRAMVRAKKSPVSQRYLVTSQSGIKKMARMHI